MATKKFKCNVCGYIHEGDAAPANCPVCGVPASEFTELKPEKKGLFSDKNGNAYIIMYSTVMVVIVATLLALAALGLVFALCAFLLLKHREMELSLIHISEPTRP